MKRKLLSLIVTLLASLSASAYDFMVDGLCYDMNSDRKSVSVTYQINDYGLCYSEYSGSVTIPATINYDGTTYSVTAIGNHAFSLCNYLTSVTIPKGVTCIGSHAFGGCFSLTSVTVPEGVKNIGDGAFCGCGNLTSITILEGVTTIGNEVFMGCFSLTSVTLPTSLTTIGSRVFVGCDSLASITLPEGVASIGDNAFDHSLGLTTVTLPASLTRIGNEAFAGCWLLTSIIIPEGVTSIGNRAFAGSDLTSVTVKNLDASAITLGVDVFGNVDLTQATLYVPSPGRESYANADQWKDFGTIVEYDPTAIRPVRLTHNAPAPAYILSGLKATPTAKGIVIRGGKKVVVK